MAEKRVRLDAAAIGGLSHPDLSIDFETMGGCTVSYTVKTSAAYDIGGVVFLSFRLQWSFSDVGSASGALRINGLPEAADDTPTLGAQIDVDIGDWPDGVTSFRPVLDTGPRLNVAGAGSGLPGSPLTATAFDNATSYGVSGSIIYVSPDAG